MHCAASIITPINDLSSLIPISISKKSRKEEEKATGDGIYYEQLIPPLVKQMHKALRSGQLGILHPGSHLLARYEDRTVWIQMAEKGNGYVYYLAKGMILHLQFQGVSLINKYLPMHTYKNNLPHQSS